MKGTKRQHEHCESHGGTERPGPPLHRWRRPRKRHLGQTRRASRQQQEKAGTRLLPLTGLCSPVSSKSKDPPERPGGRGPETGKGVLCSSGSKGQQGEGGRGCRRCCSGRPLQVVQAWEWDLLLLHC